MKHIHIALAAIMALNSTASWAAPTDTDVVVDQSVQRSVERIKQILQEMREMRADIEGMTQKALLKGDISTEWSPITDPAMAQIIRAKFLPDPRPTSTPAGAKAGSYVLLQAAPTLTDEQFRRLENLQGQAQDPQLKCAVQVNSVMRPFVANRREKEAVEQLTLLFRKTVDFNQLMLDLQSVQIPLALNYPKQAQEVESQINEMNEWRLHKNIDVILTDARQIFSERRCQGEVSEALVGLSKVLTMNVANPANIRDWRSPARPDVLAARSERLSEAQKQIFQAAMGLSMLGAKFGPQLEKLEKILSRSPREQLTKDRYTNVPDPVMVRMPFQNYHTAIATVAGIVALGFSAFLPSPDSARHLPVRIRPAYAMIGFFVSGAIALKFAFSGVEGKWEDRNKSVLVERGNVEKFKQNMQDYVNQAEFSQRIQDMADAWQTILGLTNDQTVQLADALKDRILRTIQQSTYEQLSANQERQKNLVELKVDFKDLLTQLKLIDANQLAFLQKMDEDARRIGQALKAAQQVAPEETLQLSTLKLKEMLRVYERLIAHAEPDIKGELSARIEALKAAITYSAQTSDILRQL